MKTKVKNGYIEILRFVFAIGIIGGHFIGYTEEEVLGKYYHFSNGWIGVEFFLLLTGYFLAVDINKKRALSSRKSFSECLKKIVSRYFRIMKYYAFALAVIVLINQIFSNWNFDLLKANVISAVKNIFMLDMLGIFSIEPLFPYNWYLSAMLIAFVVIYPIAYYSNELIRKVIMPVIGFCLMLLVFHNTGHITVLYEKMWGVYYGTWRAIAEIMIGMGILSVKELIDKLWHSGFSVIRMIFEVLGIAVALVYTHLYTDQTYVIYVVVAMAVSIAFSFSEYAVLPKYFDNQVVRYLGKLSLPLYVNQFSGFLITMKYWGDAGDVTRFVWITVFTVVISVVEVFVLGRGRIDN